MAIKGQVASHATGGPVFLARAPVVSHRRQVLAYRMLVGRPIGLEAGDENLTAMQRAFAGRDGIALTHGRTAFVPVAADDLSHEAVRALPVDRVVLELNANLRAYSDLPDAVNDAKARGYRIALDNFAVDAPAARLVPQVDFLKVNVRDSQAMDRSRMVAYFRQGTPALIATGVETAADVEAAARDGFQYFQGFFFGRPEVSSDRRMSPDQVTCLRLLRALNNPNLSITELEDLVKHDAALCYRILQVVNSAAFARRTTVSSMHDALLMLGRDFVRKWASLWAVAGLNPTADHELLVMATVRARLCEVLATSSATVEPGEAFLLGMCSLFDAILGRPMTDIVADLPLSDTTKQALCGAASAEHDLLACVVAYERGEWAECEASARRSRVNTAVLPGAFLEAVRWAEELNVAD